MDELDKLTQILRDRIGQRRHRGKQSPPKFEGAEVFGKRGRLPLPDSRRGFHPKSPFKC